MSFDYCFKTIISFSKLFESRWTFLVEKNHKFLNQKIHKLSIDQKINIDFI